MTDISARCGGDSDRPLVAGTLRGYRTWRPLSRWVAMPQGSLPLTSVTQQDVTWTATLTARCIPYDPWVPIGQLPARPACRSAPAVGCRCGIYAWYKPSDTAMLHARVFGAIQGSGVVLMGDRGFRAERARIAAIVTRNRRIAAACGEAGIAVYARRRDLVRDYPPEDLSSLLGGNVAAPRAQPPTPPATSHLGLLWAVCGRTAAIAFAGIALPERVAVTAAMLAEVFLFLLIALRI